MTFPIILLDIFVNSSHTISKSYLSHLLRLQNATMDMLSAPSLPRPAAHKRQQVAEKLRQVVSELQIGDRLPSVTQLEKHFGVAKSTVEAAVGQLQAEGLLVRRQGSGTFVSSPLLAPGQGGVPLFKPPTGRMLITSIGLGSSLNIFSALAEALASEMGKAGYDPVLLFEASAQQRLAQVQARYAAGSADGYVHMGSLDGNVTFPPLPGVVLGEMPEAAPVHQVTVDNYGGGRTAGAYLWDLGHRRIAFVAVKGLLPAAPRFQGMADVLRERSCCTAEGGGNEAVSLSESYVNLTKSLTPSLETELRRLLDLPQPPTAFFFANDQTAFSALQILLAWGLRVPHDVSVVSFDDTPGLASHTRPALTCLRMPILSLASLTVQTLRQAIQEPVPLRRFHLPAELIVRESSGPPPSV